MEQTLRDLKKLLRLRMNGMVSTSMRERGMAYPINFGLDAVNIREIASKFTPDEALADRLWGESARECRILATLLHPKDAFTREKANRWVADCFVPELTEQLCFNLLQYLPWATSLADEWIASPETALRTAGYTLGLRLLLRKAVVENLNEWVTRSQEDRFSEEYQLQLTAARFYDRATFVF